MAIKFIPPTPPAAIAPTTKKEAVITNDLSELPKLAVPPGKPPQIAAERQPEGYVIEHSIDPKHNKVTFTKVVTMDTKDGKPRTLLLHRPIVKFKIGSHIAFEFGSHEGKPTVIKPTLLNEQSKIGNLLNYINDDNVSAHTGAREMFIPHLTERYLTSKEEDIAKFLKSQGINYIICVVDNKVIYRGND